MKKIKWGVSCPLVGGFPIGAETAIGTPPSAVYGFDGFWGNDRHYMNWQNETNKKNINYEIMGNDSKKQKLNIVVATCPCAALSMLNTGKSKTRKGADAEQNEFMYQSARFSIENNDVDVLIGENAPGLYSDRGKPVADKLSALAEEYGYSFSLYKTSTAMHGIPQNRHRTFYFMWKSKTAPILEWYKRPYISLKKFLEEIPKDALHQDLIINKKLASDPYLMFINERTDGKGRQTLIKAETVTAFQWIHKNGLLPDFITWAYKNENETAIKYGLHAKKKFDQGLGIWDNSTHVFNETINAIVSRNLCDSLHPTKNRSLTLREGMHLMGLPMEFELLDGLKNYNHICQNVPSVTARDMTEQAVKFLCGELKDSGQTNVRQDNFKETTNIPKVTSTLAAFLE